jgi:hypothetical protein
MSNDHLMYYSDSVKCDIKVEFEDWESKFTPGGWRASGLFDTLEGKTINSLRLSLLPLKLKLNLGGMLSLLQNAAEVRPFSSRMHLFLDTHIELTIFTLIAAHFWWDIDNCMAISPRDAKFSFEFKLSDLKAPVSCQEVCLDCTLLNISSTEYTKLHLMI